MTQQEITNELIDALPHFESAGETADVVAVTEWVERHRDNATAIAVAIIDMLASERQIHDARKERFGTLR